MADNKIGIKNSRSLMIRDAAATLDNSIKFLIKN